MKDTVAKMQVASYSSALTDPNFSSLTYIRTIIRGVYRARRLSIRFPMDSSTFRLAP